MRCLSIVKDVSSCLVFFKGRYLSCHSLSPLRILYNLLVCLGFKMRRDGLCVVEIIDYKREKLKYDVANHA